MLQQYLPFTVLKLKTPLSLRIQRKIVATVLTVYGIETVPCNSFICSHFARLQQYLPFTVLKQNKQKLDATIISLQQYLPFTVLKPATMQRC